MGYRIYVFYPRGRRPARGASAPVKWSIRPTAPAPQIGLESDSLPARRIYGRVIWCTAYCAVRRGRRIARRLLGHPSAAPSQGLSNWNRKNDPRQADEPQSPFKEKTGLDPDLETPSAIRWLAWGCARHGGRLGRSTCPRWCSCRLRDTAFERPGQGDARQ